MKRGLLLGSMARRLVLLVVAIFMGAFCGFRSGTYYTLLVSESYNDSVVAFLLPDSRIIQEKTILFWTNVFEKPFPFYNSAEPFLANCPAIHGCRITNDRSLLGSASAVIFHWANLDWSDIPKTRDVSQRYIFYTHESAGHPFYNPELTPWKMYFNWTMTVRSDSDIPWPYGEIVPLPVTSMPSWQQKAILSKKTKLIAWMVSNCYTQSRREVYVNALKQHVPVDIYGNCGKLQCSIYTHGECLQMISNQYRFYLALENSACKDYITEKLWLTLDHHIVPIVLKRSLMLNLVPPDSFIALDDFSGPLALAEHLKMLAENDTAYLQYFQWKQNGFVGIRAETRTVKGSRLGQLAGHHVGICRLCEMLKDEKYPRNVYEDISNWFSEGFQCDPGIGARLATNRT